MVTTCIPPREWVFAGSKSSPFGTPNITTFVDMLHGNPSPSTDYGNDRELMGEGDRVAV